MASTEPIKRVISNPDNQMRTKITKVDASTPDNEETNEELLTQLNISDAPVPTVSSHVESEADSSLSDENVTSAAGNDKSMQRTISSESNKTDSTGEARVSVGNWGWFEDVHGHESVFLPGMKLDEGEERKGDNKEDKKKGRLLQMGSELMQSGPIYSNVESQRGEC